MDILATIDNSVLRRRGTMRVWMVDNRDALADRLTTHRPDWSLLADVFANAGLLDSRGNRPTAEATRKTWYRVKADTAKAKTMTTAASLRQADPSPPPVMKETGPMTAKAASAQTDDDIKRLLQGTGRQIPKPIH